MNSLEDQLFLKITSTPPNSNVLLLIAMYSS